MKTLRLEPETRLAVQNKVQDRDVVDKIQA